MKRKIGYPDYLNDPAAVNNEYKTFKVIIEFSEKTSEKRPLFRSTRDTIIKQNSVFTSNTNEMFWRGLQKLLTGRGEPKN